MRRGEFRAGWLDARRTTGARPWHGRRFGDAYYSAGYAAGALRVPARLRPCAECGARRGRACDPDCTGAAAARDTR
jgi:hypothetical protein